MSFNYIGPINSTGYGVASAGYLSQLIKLEPNIGFSPIGNIQSTPELSNELLDSAQKRFDVNNPSFCFWHLFDIPSRMQECKGKKVAMSTFELSTLKDVEIKALDTVDELATASNWGKDILKKYTDTPVHIIPHAFKSEKNTKLPEYSPNIDFASIWSKIISPEKIDKKAIILSSAGKYESRKGHPELIDACIEIGRETPIVLVLFCYNHFIHGNFPYGYINKRFMYPCYTNSGVKVFSKGNFKLILMPPSKTMEELHGALSKAHFFISPSKGEGWNLPLFEMMSYGMPCITTLNTAHLDYCDTDSCIEVESDKNTPFVRAYDGVFFDGKYNWNNITSNGIYTSIKKAIDIKGTSVIQKISKNARQKTSKFSWQKSAKKIIKIMS